MNDIKLLLESTFTKRTKIIDKSGKIKGYLLDTLYIPKDQNNKDYIKYKEQLNSFTTMKGE